MELLSLELIVLSVLGILFALCTYLLKKLLDIQIEQYEKLHETIESLEDTIEEQKLTILELKYGFASKDFVDKLYDTMHKLENRFNLMEQKFKDYFLSKTEKM